MRGAVPRRLRPCDADKDNAKRNFPTRHNYHKRLYSFHSDKKLANTHTVKPESSPRKPPDINTAGDTGKPDTNETEIPYTMKKGAATRPHHLFLSFTCRLGRR